MTLEGGKVLRTWRIWWRRRISRLMLSNLGYKVVASTGNKHAGDKLEALGLMKLLIVLQIMMKSH